MSVNADRVVFGSVGFMTLNNSGEQEQAVAGGVAVTDLERDKNVNQDDDDDFGQNAPENSLLSDNNENNFQNENENTPAPKKSRGK